MNFSSDDRIVMTLDAGGTNFVFSAVQGNKEIIPPIGLPSNAHDLNLCLGTIVDGFKAVQLLLPRPAVAISFAFPGPADYPQGIIGDLGNLPAFRGGVPLADFLRAKFQVPVFINNDGDLFAYGEALAGFLPYVNDLLIQAGSPRRFKNLVGLTLGTGFGGGIVRNGELFIGDNSSAGEVWLLRNKLHPEMNAEEGASIRAVQQAYCDLTHRPVAGAPSPREISTIARSETDSTRNAAIEAFRLLGEVVGDALATVLTLVDGLAVIGGGVAGSHDLFLDTVVREMNTPYTFNDGQTRPRLVSTAFNLAHPSEMQEFLCGAKKTICVPDTGAQITYDPLRRIGVGVSRLGTSTAVSIGAYSFALNALEKK
jgi:glucokinase